MVVPIAFYRRRHMHRSPLSILMGMLIVFTISGLMILLKSKVRINLAIVLITIGIVMIVGFVIILVATVSSSERNRQLSYNGANLYRQRSPIQKSPDKYYYQDNELSGRSAGRPMYCNACGEELSIDAIFCPKCGTKVRGMAY